MGTQHPEFDRAQQIRRTMAMIRRELNADVDQVEKSARTLLDWRYYVNNYPWACVGVAAAVGYLAVPRKVEIHQPDPKTIEKLARNHRLVVEQKPKAEAKAGLVGAAFSLISGLVLKTAMAQLGNQLAGLMERKPEPRAEEPGWPAPGYSSATMPPRR